MREFKLALVVHMESFPCALTISGTDWIWKEEVYVQSSYLPTSVLDVYKTATLLHNHRWCDHFFLGEMQFTIHQLKESDGLPGKGTPIYILFQDQRSLFLFWYSLQKDGSLGKEASHLHNHTWSYPSTSWAQHVTVLEKIFMHLSHILSSLCQGKRHVSLAVIWVRKPQNVALMPTTSCCESAKSLILWTNTDNDPLKGQAWCQRP